MNVQLLLEVKEWYTDYLVDTLTPFIYEGLLSLYTEAVSVSISTGTPKKSLLLFQKYLQSIDGWTQYKIDEETNRIKQNSGTAEVFDDLVKSVIRSYIILLTYSNNVSNVIAQTFYNNMSTSDLIHRCYIECAKDAHNHPYLFLHDIDPLDQKRNQVLIERNIQQGIVRGIRKILPIGLILKEYLANSINIIPFPIDAQATRDVELVGRHNGAEAAGMGGILPMPVAAPAPPLLQQPFPAAPIVPPGPAVQPPLGPPVPLAPAPLPSAKSDKPKSATDQKLDKMINSASKRSDANKIADMVRVQDAIEKSLSQKVPRRESDRPKAAESRRSEKKMGGDYAPANRRLGDSDRAILDIKFGSSSEEEESNSDDVTNFSNENRHQMQPRPQSNRQPSRPADPHKGGKKKYIEEYGTPTEDIRKRR